MQITRLAGESAEYTAAREHLRRAEIELTEHRERVAARRRALPPGSVVDDDVFLEGPRALADGDEPVTEVRLSELFGGPGRPLVAYHLMYGKAQSVPCPMCTQWIDGFNGVAHHLARNIDFVVVAAADPPALHTYTGRPRLSEDRGERGIDLLCATWHVLDLTPQGRGDWYSSLDYGTAV